MADHFFRKKFPDYEDRENSTMQRPGFEVNVVEHDGGVCLSMSPLPGLEGEGLGRAQVLMTPRQGHALLQGLLDAIDRAETRRPRRPPPSSRALPRRVRRALTKKLAPGRALGE